MYRNVVVGIGGHPQDRAAIKLARRIARADATFTLVHGSVEGSIPAGDPGLELRLNRSACIRDVFAEQLALCPPKTKIVREFNYSIGEAMGAAITRLEADLMVIGATSEGVARVLGPDPVKSALRNTRCPVAIATLGSPDRAITRIGVACDDTDRTLSAVAHAGLLARELEARLMPIGIVEPRAYATEFDLVAGAEDFRNHLDRTRERLRSTVGRDVEVTYGPVSSALRDFTEKVDLLVCGSRRLGRVTQAIMGSTSIWLSRHARCHLLIAPNGDAAAIQAWQEAQSLDV